MWHLDRFKFVREEVEGEEEEEEKKEEEVVVVGDVAPPLSGNAKEHREDDVRSDRVCTNGTKKNKPPMIRIVQETPPPAMRRKRDRHMGDEKPTGKKKKSREIFEILETDEEDGGEGEARRHNTSDSLDTSVSSIVIKKGGVTRRRNLVVSSDDDEEDVGSVLKPERTGRSGGGEGGGERSKAVMQDSLISMKPHPCTPPQWACSKCTLLNPEAMKVCIMCGKKRPQKPLPQEWSCSMCTFVNKWYAQKCDVCELVRPKEKTRVKMRSRKRDSCRTTANKPILATSSSSPNDKDASVVSRRSLVVEDDSDDEDDSDVESEPTRRFRRAGLSKKKRKVIGGRKGNNVIGGRWQGSRTDRKNSTTAKENRKPKKSGGRANRSRGGGGGGGRRRRQRRSDDDDDSEAEALWDSQVSDTASSGIEHSESENSDDEDLEDQIEPLIRKCRQIHSKLSAKPEDADRHVLESANLLGELPFDLKSYQVDGLRWLYNMYRFKVSGILADQMGLGKTVQTCALLTLLNSRSSSSPISSPRPGPHLVIVPASVAHNWMRELALWCPKLSVILYHGPKSERLKMQPRLSRVNVVVATYTMFEKSSGSEDRHAFRKIRWSMLILDEGHCIKNASSGRTNNLRKIRSECRLILTGTPIQNDLPELLALLAFLMPTVFDPSLGQLAKLFDEAKVGSGGSSEAKENEERIARRLESVKSVFAPFLMRRVKSNVLADLAPKRERVDFLTMPENQSAVYRSVMSAARHFIESEETSKQSKRKRSKRRVHLFSELRKAANHPLLLRRHFGSDPEQLSRVAMELHQMGAFGNECNLRRVVQEIEDNMSDFTLHQMCSEYAGECSWLRSVLLPASAFEASAKFIWLREHLPDMLRKGDRVLIFSQWTSILDIMEVFLDNLSTAYYRIDGSTPVEERQPLIDAYNAPGANVDVFLLSTRAGGMGINLTSANVVVMHDIDFNPQNDLQAQDRCHRIGQKRLVKIVRLITKGTVDEQIMRISDRKRFLHDALLVSPSKQRSRHAALLRERNAKRSEMLEISDALEAAVKQGSGCEKPLSPSASLLAEEEEGECKGAGGPAAFLSGDRA